MTLLANGVNPAGLTFSDVAAIADMLAATGRAVPAVKWVDELRDSAADARNEQAMAIIFG